MWIQECQGMLGRTKAHVMANKPRVLGSSCRALKSCRAAAGMLVFLPSRESRKPSTQVQHEHLNILSQKSCLHTARSKHLC